MRIGSLFDLSWRLAHVFFVIVLLQHTCRPSGDWNIDKSPCIRRCGQWLCVTCMEIPRPLNILVLTQFDRDNVVFSFVFFVHADLKLVKKSTRCTWMIFRVRQNFGADGRCLIAAVWRVNTKTRGWI